MKGIRFDSLAPCPSKTRLALDIILEHFGDITHDVAETISRSETPTLAYLVRTLGSKYCKKKELSLNLTQIRHALLVLYQHNCLHVTLPPAATVEGDAPSVAADKLLNQKGLIYRLNQENILSRLRFAKLIQIVRDLFGEIGVSIMEQLIDLGRLTPKEIRLRALQKLSLEYESAIAEIDQIRLASESNGQATAVIPDNLQQIAARGPIQEALVKQTLEQLIQRRLIVSVATIDFKKSFDERKAFASQLLSTSQAAAKGASSSSSATAIMSPDANGRGADASRTVITKQKRKFQELSANPNSEADAYLPLEMRLSAAPVKAEKPVAANEQQSTSQGSSAANTTATTSSRPSRGRGRGAGGRGGRGTAAKSESNSSSSSSSSSSAEVHSKAAAASTGMGFGTGLEGFPLFPLNSESGTAADGPREDIMWTIGWDQFLREERHALCICYTCDRMEALAGRIVQLMLDYSMPSELSTCEAFSKKIGLSQLHELLVRNSNSNSKSSPFRCVYNDSNVAQKNKNLNSDFSKVDTRTLTELLDVLRTDHSEIVNKVHRSEAEVGGPFYRVNMESIIGAVHKKIIHNIAVERYGVAAGRIVELLLHKNNLDQQVISDMIIIPAKETRERLYRLHKDQWIDCNEISKRPDFNPSATSYFWKIDRILAGKSILDHLYVALLNVRLRRNHQYQQGKSILDIPRLNLEEEIQYDLLSRSLDRLDKAVLMVDQTLLILSKFA